MILLLACKGGPDSPPDSEAPPPIEVPLTTELPPGASSPTPTLAAVHTLWGEGPLLGESLDPTDLPDRPPEAHLQLASRAHPDLRAAFYLLLAFEDDDGDAALDPGETLLGGDLERMLVYLEGEPGDGAEAWPLDRWVLVDTGMAGQWQPNRCHLDSTEPLLWREDEGYPIFSELESRVILLRGAAAPLPLAGSADPGTVQGVAYQQVRGDAGFSPVFEAPVADGAWAATLEEDPPSFHVVNSDPEWGYTLHYLLHTDEDGAWSGAQGCVDGEPTWARWTRPVNSFKGLRLLECYDGTVGWRLAQNDPASGAVVYLPAEAALDLDLRACP